MTEASEHAGDMLGEGPLDDPGDGEPDMSDGERRETSAAVGGSEAHVKAEAAGEDAEEVVLPDDEAQRAAEVAEAWLAELADQVSVPASEVQDHLLDIWGALDEGPARVEVEQWLTETLRRSLYSVSDVNERLESLLPTG